MAPRRHIRTRESSTTPQRRIGWVRRDGGCRDNPQQQMAPRRWGSRVPSLRTVGSLGPRPFSYAEVHAGLRAPLLAVRPRSLWDASPGVMSQPPVSLARFSGRRPCARSAIARGRRLLTHSPRREVVSRPVQLGVLTPRHLGDENSGWQLGSGLFGMPAREIRVNPLQLIGPWVVALR